MKGIVATVSAAVIAASAGAGTLSVSLASGNLAASAQFEVIGTDLQVTLTNTSAFDVLVPADVLTGVFWDVNGPLLGLGRGSAVLGPGSVVHFGATDPGGAVGGEFAYREGISGPRGAAYGISSAGLGLFGPHDRFPGSNLEGPKSVGGLNYGIVPSADDLGVGNTPVTGDVPLIQDSVVFRLVGIAPDFDPEIVITNVNFQYGTNTTEPNLPEPSGMMLLMCGAGVMLRRFR